MHTDLGNFVFCAFIFTTKLEATLTFGVFFDVLYTHRHTYKDYVVCILFSYQLLLCIAET